MNNMPNASGNNSRQLRDGAKRAGVLARQHQADGDPGDREQQRHAPAVEHDPDEVQPLVGVTADDVEIRVRLVHAADVVEDQDGKGEDAQGVDIVSARHGLAGRGRGARLPRVIAAPVSKVAVRMRSVTNGGVEGAMEDEETVHAGRMRGCH